MLSPEEISKIKEANIKTLSQATRETNPLYPLYKKIIDETEFIDATFPDVKISFSLRVHCVENNITKTPKCKECGNITSLRKYSTTFNTFCSNECRAKNNNALDEKIYETLSDYDWFYEKRILNKMSYKDIGEVLGISEIPVREYAKKHKLDKERYNESSPFAMAKLRDKEWLKTEHTTNHRSCEEIANELGVSKSTVSVHLAKHGIVANPANSYDRNSGKESLDQQEIRLFIESFGFKVKSNDRTILDGYEIDILLEEQKLGIEYHGLYSHIFRPHESEFAKRKDQHYHKMKFERALEKGVHLIQIFSDQWADKKEIVKNILKSKLGITQKIYARKCYIQEISPSEKRKFLDDNHIQGNDTSSIRYGLFYNDEIVAVMTFCKNKRSKQYTWELNRYCSKIGVTVVGGFSKLLTHFRKNNDGSIISYSDCMWSQGNVYKKNGFSFSHKDRPGYYYVSPCYTKRFHRTNFRKSKISDGGDARTENEIMTEKGYNKIFNAGLYVWVFNNT